TSPGGRCPRASRRPSRRHRRLRRRLGRNVHGAPGKSARLYDRLFSRRVPAERTNRGRAAGGGDPDRRPRAAPRGVFCDRGRRDAGGGAQPVIDGVRSFALDYLDASDRAVVTADEARTVVITLVTEAAWDLADRAVVTTYSTRVRLRNR